MTRAEWDALSEWWPEQCNVFVAEALELPGLGLYRRIGWRDTGMVEVQHPGDLGADDGRPLLPIAPGWRYQPAPGLFHAVPPFTTSWDAMREVVEKMSADGFVCELLVDVGNNEWTEAIFWDRDGKRDLRSVADTLPEAVAVAALTALGHMEGS